MKRQRESVNEIQQQMVEDCYMLYLHRTTPSISRADDDCQITFSSPNVSFGWLKQDDIVNSQQGWNQMSHRRFTLVVSCPKARILLFLCRPLRGKGTILFWK
ncbi:membrane protein [Salmonella enterica subsp. enterica]|uniref:Membrane protein n=1 Tax=Salmonella enterica I TaxID=59201 RepID=A0A3S4JBJ9_SALET|nr:membrane protein [Salmonella enterica subsp. enterica]